MASILWSCFDHQVKDGRPPFSKYLVHILNRPSKTASIFYTLCFTIHVSPIIVHVVNLSMFFRKSSRFFAKIVQSSNVHVLQLSHLTRYLLTFDVKHECFCHLVELFKCFLTCKQWRAGWGHGPPQLTYFRWGRQIHGKCPKIFSFST